jgi:serine/alanine adding enzyme
MQILRNNFIERAKWLNFYRSNEFSTPFQSPAYFDFVNSVTDFSAEVFAVEEQNEIKALCVVVIQKELGLKSYFSRRGVIYGGPLIKHNSPEALQKLLTEVNKELKNRVIYVETRNLYDYSVYKEVFKSYGWNYQPELNYHLDCSSEETAWKNFNTSRRRQIRKALKNGVVIAEASGVEEVRKYHKILDDLFTTKVKKPLAPFEWFKKMYENDLAKFLLVKYDSKIVGGIVAPVLENKTIYELNVCGLDYEYKDAYPSVMATFAAIEYGYKNGLKRFDFMGAGSPDDDYGVREFKSKFGGTEVEHGRFLRVYNPMLYNIGKLAVTKLKWLVK